MVANSCPFCRGTRVCVCCRGRGHRKITRGQFESCRICNESGTCDSCESHCKVLIDYGRKLLRQEFALAEATIRGGLIRTGEEESARRSGTQAAMTIAGAVAGSALGPSGMFIGSMIGRALGEGGGTSDHARWQQADLLYGLGVLAILQRRKDEARQVWIQTLTLHPHHEAAQKALRELV